MKAKYEKPELNISKFSCEDIMTLSSVQSKFPLVDAESLDGYFSETL